ncbi:MAG TPA: type II toxin-antitoxin system VapC family toxin [Acinetobacter parvus]|jgi:hypothetical protein|uniref:type II toxin-antitoxin system VapC family toxin n=1 Tax=Acinetobacter parvus TaxID=134533 RepID=UPI002B8185BC|nr:type II toxin-antitoxin system VapC family toxin [Acinetobacter parvus]HRM15318.1 type II toxin-antitoxin system VapC family toxin [Acinetobacter parvus]
MQKYVFDTNAILYAISQGVEIEKNMHSISVITEMELLSYPQLTLQDEVMLRGILSFFQHIELTTEIKQQAIWLRKNTGLKLPDSIVAATALITNCILLTSDKKLLKVPYIQSVSFEQVYQ